MKGVKALWNDAESWELAETVAAYCATIFTAVAGTIALLVEKNRFWYTFPVVLLLMGVNVVGILAKHRRQRIVKLEEAEEAKHRASLQKRCAQCILVRLREVYFASCPADRMYQNRVSLFILDEPNKRLRLFARAGESGQNAEVSFSVDEARLDRCEGVAGQIWFKNAIMIVNLPTWPTDETDAAGRTAYATVGFLTVERANRLNIKSRAITGTTVRIHGRKWGVLILDSESEEWMKNTPHARLLVDRYALVLADVLLEVAR